MKRILHLVVSMLFVVCITQVYAGKPTPETQQVEVVNNSVAIQGHVDVMNTPLDVNVVTESKTYEYVVLNYAELYPDAAVAKFQEGLNTFSSGGWEFVSWRYSVYKAQGLSDALMYEYTVIMKRPMLQ